MRRTLAVLLALVPLSLSAAAQLLQLPAGELDRLAGRWQLDTADTVANPAERRVISLSTEAFRIEIQRVEDARPPVLTYRFDGRDVVNPFGTGTATSRLLREGGAVVTETIYEIRDSPITVRETLRVSPDGTELRVSRVVRVEHGYEGQLAAGESKPPNVSNATMLFRRQP